MRLVISLLVLLLLSSCNEDNNPIPPPVVTYTQISGRVSGEFVSSESPYRVIQDIIVDSNSVLIINAGVKIFFDEHTRLIVKGELKVLGNQNSKVLMIPWDENKPWKGIKIIYADKPSVFEFVEIMNIRESSDSNYISSSISIVSSEVEIIRTAIYNNSAVNGGAIGLYNSKLLLCNNLIRDNTADIYGGAIVSEASKLTAINNSFYHNYCFNYCGGIFVKEPVKTEIQNNIFYENSSRQGDFHFNYVADDSTTLTNIYNYYAFNFMDPKFIDKIELRLSSDSQCINSGNPEIIFNDYDNSRNDQGAYGGPLGNW
jgi:hypothetical protein